MKRIWFTAGLIALSVGQAASHPHVFVDGGADFLFDDAGHLSAVRVTWRYDAFVTLFALESLGVDQDGDGVLTDAEKDIILRDQTEWEDDFAGDSYLWANGAQRALSDAENASVALIDGRLEVTFDRLLDKPIPTDRLDAVLKLYDPFYYFAYTATDEPKLIGGPAICRSHVKPFELDGTLAALQTTLFELGREETPEQQDVGALFADEIVLKCD